MRPRATGRALHPMAWWAWAISLAVAASRTTNPLVLLVILGVLGFVVAARRTAAPWARAFKYYLVMALVVVAIRVVFRSVFTTGVAPGDHVLFTLPQLHSPHWYAGITIGGPVSLEGTLAAVFDGLRLGTLLCCIGAANVLANPKRALRVLPGALYELGVAVVVALSVAPQLVESVQRVRRARRLRGGAGKGLRALRSIVVPVLEDALERSLLLAAAMDSRGYGRVGRATRGSRRVTAALLLGGMCGLCAGVYALLDDSIPRAVGLPVMLGGAVLCAAGLALGGRRVHRSQYRPDPWRAPEWIVTGGGVLAVVVMFVGAGDAALNPGVSPLVWPPLPIVPVLGVVVAGLAALAAPMPSAGRSRTAAPTDRKPVEARERVSA